MQAKGILLDNTFYQHSQEARVFRKTVKEWAEKRVAPASMRLDAGDASSVLGEVRQILKKTSEIRLLSIIVPEDLGGAGGLTYMGSNALEVVSYYDAGIATSIGAVWLGLLPVFIAGIYDNGESWRKWLGPFASADEAGDPPIWAFAITEPTAGSDYERVEPGSTPEYITVARPEGDGGYRLSGRKIFISNGPIADYVTVFAVLDKSKPLETMTCMVVEKGEYSVGTVYEKMGHRSSPTGELVFEDVSIPRERVLCPPGSGWDIIEITLAYSRTPVGAIGLGIAKRSLEEALMYASTRIQGGKPIVMHQTIKMKIASMIERVAAAEYTIYGVSRLLEEKFPPPIEESSIGKVVGGDAAVHNALDAIQIMGGLGYIRETGVEKLLRDAKLIQIYEGTNEINRLSFVEGLMKRLL